MILKEALYRYLQTVTDLTDEVGTRMYRNTVPEKTVKPYISYFIISGDPNPVARLNTDFLQFNIFDSDPDKCDEIYDILFNALQNKGTLIGGVGGKILVNTKVITNRDAAEFDTEIYQKSVDIKITYWR